mgnify:CR=1 FL=1
MAGKNKAKRKPATPRNRAGLLPDQYRKRSTVYVERVRRADEEHRYSVDEMMATDVYYVETLRTDGNWQHRIDIQGETFVIPGKVFERIASQRDAIIKEGRRERAQQTHERLKAKAEADQAEAERARDLQGL